MRIRFEGDCWIWTGDLNSTGYGRVPIDGKRHLAHRASYRLFVGPILAGMTLDHLCRNPKCVNPAHLEQVNMRENILRGTGPTAQNAHKTHCKRGHPFDKANTYWTPAGFRQCRKCKASLERDRQRRLRH